MDASQMPQLPSIPDTHPSSAILDSYRIAIAKRLSESLSLTLEQAFSGVDYGKKGEDFTVALPRFRLPGKVGEIAKQVIDKVSLMFGCLVSAQTTRTTVFAIQAIYTLFIYRR
jgi:hypothetical protein